LRPDLPPLVSALTRRGNDRFRRNGIHTYSDQECPRSARLSLPSSVRNGRKGLLDVNI